jgi:hypothetical protein
MIPVGHIKAVLVNRQAWSLLTGFHVGNQLFICDLQVVTAQQVMRSILLLMVSGQGFPKGVKFRHVTLLERFE